MEMRELYQRYSRDVYRYAYWLSGSAADADDVTSETFVRAWTSHRPVRTATAKAYLLKIARNLFLEGRRRQRDTIDLTEDLPDPNPDPERRLSSLGEIAAVREALARLSEIDRSALLLRVEEDLPYAEIARVLEVTAAAARVKVHRARLRLATHLAESSKSRIPKEAKP